MKRLMPFAMVLFFALPGTADVLSLGAGGGLAVPLSRYIKTAPVKSGYGLKDVQNGLGWNVHAELNIIGLEIRYEWKAFTWKRIVDNLGNELSTDGLPWLQWHTITIGLRWYPVKSKFRLYLPFGLGPTFVTFNDVDKLKGQYGATVYAGLEMEYAITKGFKIGLGTRYNFYVTTKPKDLVEGAIKERVGDKLEDLKKNPPTDLQSINPASIAQVKTEDVIGMFHALTVHLTMTLGF